MRIRTGSSDGFRTGASAPAMSCRVAIASSLFLLLAPYACRRDAATEAPVAEDPQSLDQVASWAYERLTASPSNTANTAGVAPANPGFAKRPGRPLRFGDLLPDASIDCDWSPPQSPQGLTTFQLDCSLRKATEHCRAAPRHGPPQGDRFGRRLTIRGLNLDGREVGEIQLRADFGRASEFMLTWSVPGIITLPCKPGQGMITRSIPTDALSDWRQPIRKLTIAVADREGCAIRVESISLVPPKTAYPEPVGTRPVMFGRELRPAIYAHAPATITFRDVALPEHGRLTTGLGIPGDSPIRFRISVRDDDREELLLDEECSQPTEWIDAFAELGSWGGRTVDVLLTVDGPAGNVACWSEPLCYAPQPEPARVLVYLIDTLGAGHMGLYGYERDTTPRLEAFAAGGTWFANAFANASRTIESIPNIMLSMPTVSHGVNDSFLSVPGALDLLAEDFQRAGFATACFSTNVNAGPRQALDRGFDSFFDHLAYFWSEGDTRTVPIDEVVRWLDRHRDRPVFLYVHTAEPHSPYDAPPPFGDRFDPYYDGRITGSHADKRRGFMTARTPRDVEHVIALYDGEVAYADHRFGEFMDRLNSEGLSEGWVTVVTSDHGEQFLEHGNWVHGANVHGELTRVPLIFAGPRDRVPSGRVDAPVQLQDVRPTLLELCGIQTAERMFGDSLVPLMHGRDAERFRKRPILMSTFQPLPAHHAIIKMPYKIMFAPTRRRNQRTAFELYNIEEDPAETVDLLESHPEIAAEMIRELVRVREAYPRFFRGDATDANTPMDPEMLERLRALGYVAEDESEDGEDPQDLDRTQGTFRAPSTNTSSGSDPASGGTGTTRGE